MRNRSFRGQLFRAFLAVSLIPLLICSALLLQIFRLRMTDAVREEMREDLEKAVRTMDGAFSAVEEAASRLRGDLLLAESLTEAEGGGIRAYNALFEATAQARPYARFYLCDGEGTPRYATAPQETRLSAGWGSLRAAADSGEPLSFSACWDSGRGTVLQGAAVLRDRQGRQTGYLVVTVCPEELQTILQGTYGSQNRLLLLSRYGRPVYGDAKLRETAPRLREQLLAGVVPGSGSEEFVYETAVHPGTGLFLILQRPMIFTRETMDLLYTVSFFCAVVCVTVSVFMSLRLSRQLFRPIESLHRGIREVGQDNLDVLVPVEGENELGELARRFNAMVAALRRNRAQLLENQRELDRAQIRMLQAQLNPHFLCNTLDTMKWIGKINRIPQVAVLSTGLADILRFCISPEEFVPLRREVEILEQYIEIQRIRLSGSFDFSVEVPEELADCLIPKMILQPLVENAILHGLEGTEGGAVTVTAARQEEKLRITVADNGRGFPEELAAGRYPSGKKAGKRLGLYNVDTILSKYYGGDCGLFLHNEGGAVVTAVLPIRREEEPLC